MNIGMIAAWSAMCLGAAALPAWSAGQTLDMQVGESRVLAAPGVTQVAIGNGEVLSAVATEGREVVVFARAEGMSSVQVWADGGVRTYSVEVAPAGAPRLRAEIESLLARIPGARSSAVGGRIVIEGDDLSDDDRDRIAALAQRYPEVVDFTGQVGWDSMVLLDVQVVEIPSSRLREIGVRWDGMTQGGLNAALAWDAGSLGRIARPGEQGVDAPGALSSAAGYFGVNALLSARIAALAQSGEAVMLAQPQLLARSGASATFLAGGEVPYVSTDSRGNPTTLFKPYGVSLRITPRIDRNGVIRSLIEVEASSVDMARHPQAVDKGAAKRAEVLEHDRRRLAPQPRMLAAHAPIGDTQVAMDAAADQHRHRSHNGPHGGIFKGHLDFKHGATPGWPAPTPTCRCPIANPPRRGCSNPRP